MDIEQLSSQAANVYDDNSFIRVDHSRREQPTDNTCRPVNNPVPDRGYNFEPSTVYLNPTQAVVVALVNLLPEARYHVFLDNLFSSSNLFRRLRQLGHGAKGTARRNCGLYRLLVKLKAGDNTAAGSIPFNCLKAIPTADNLVNQIAWKVNALALFLSTVFTGNERVDRIRKRPTTDQPAAWPMQEFFGEEPVKVVSIPSIAATYNDEMNAVDRGDQMRAYWGPDRRVRRGGWRALAWDFLLEIALINSFILQQRGNPRWKPEKSQAEWRQRLVNDLVAEYEPSSPVIYIAQ
ncbi:hypothetical protein FOXG_14450 [Fusarium oxysporum f. sp. lycopersici 4287]|uniref:PiggyBac transposable element-derived protein domain-containing protein n=1 Tax=Fusarium oxysporum f. sp. lycopersici (strain 4287 / CBS 123668 / FGSC 9935 / NRRL 34936) TaxID=426428 RepID=A0A0J9W0W6_FUSO4|nr:hypothetical protein FOXG_14450 [Fusarium oxysporum f. sp. lycopersici 4287]KNB16631.1 hypothetical protein FOXG_14450 [Fusarium oxysporum f. sp. lycopersici 4287]